MKENKNFKRLITFAIAATMCLSALVVLPISTAAPTTVWVDDDYTSGSCGGHTWGVDAFDNIQDGVDNVENGGTVNVYSGTYASVVIDKTIDLIGEDKSSTYIDGGGSGDVVYITADWVSVSGFTVTGSGSSTNDAGIEIRSSYNTIINCYSYMNYGDGMHLISASSNTIENCDVFSNGFPILRDGIVLSSNSNNNIITDCDVYSNDIGIDFFYSPNNNVTNCRVYSNDHQGIYIDVNSGGSTVKNSDITGNIICGIILYATYNTVTECDICNNQYGVCTYYSYNSMIGCNISDNDYGISFYSSNNTVTECNITNNNLYGIYAYSSHPDNHMYHNNFVGNTYQACDHCACGSNVWDDGYPSGGNYWDDFDEPIEGAYDDYSGVNQDVPGSDGIVDSPYDIISYGNGNQDLYPLMNPWISAPPVLDEVWVDDDYYNGGYNDGHTWGYDAFDNIQEGVDTVSGSTVYVMPGLYTPITITTDNLNLIGPQAGVDPRPFGGTTRNPGDTLTEAVIDGGSSLTNIILIDADNVVIDGLEVRDGTGDLIYQSNAHFGTIVQNCIAHDSSGDEGIQLKRCTDGNIYRNYVYNVAGDGVDFGYSTNCAILGNEITNSNSAHGAIYVYESEAITIDSNYIHDNIAGNGILLEDNEPGIFTISNNLVENNAWQGGGNSHAEGDGNTICLYKAGVSALSIFNLVHNTLADNTGEDSGNPTGHAIFAYDYYSVGFVTNVDNNILANHNGYGIRTGLPHGAIVNYGYNDIYNNALGATDGSPNDLGGNILVDPQFVGTGDYHLQSSSPCIDTGTTSGITTDIEGNPRDANPDMGAYEYVTTNQPPVANDDSYTTDEDTSLDVAAPGVLDNDTDPDGDPLTAIKVTDPSHGSVTLNSDGSFEYIPDTNFCGSDTFTYKANDGNYDSDIATVTITVNCIQDPPVANDDYYSTNWHTSLDVAAPGVLDNDTDPDGDSLTANKLTNPSNGIITAFNSDGSFKYIPDLTFAGSDSFTYEADDGNGGTDTATVHITVIPPTCQPEVWIDDDFGPSTSGWGIDHFVSIQHALETLEQGGTAYVYDGVYDEDIVIDDGPFCSNEGITLKGEYGCFPIDDSAVIKGVTDIKVDDVTIEYLEFLPTSDAAITVEGGVSDITLRCNKFRRDCVADAVGVKNLGSSQVNAELNWWGAPDGPSGGKMDDGDIADGNGVEVIGNVDVEPWIGIHAEIAEPAGTIEVEVGTSVRFDAEGSWAYTYGECCEAEELPLQYLWDFDDGTQSANKQANHVFDTAGTYHVSLMVDSSGIPGLYSNFMYDWDYVTVHATTPGTPLTASADGENLGGYETIVGEPVQLYGDAYGGNGEYQFTWNFGDNKGTSNEQNPTHVYNAADTYTVTLIVTSGGETATDTAEVVVNDIDELLVDISDGNSIAGVETMFAASVTGGTSPYTYEWIFGDGATSSEARPSHTYATVGEYTVTVTVTDSNDNSKSDSATVTVEEGSSVEPVEIKEVSGGLGVKAVIDSGDNNVDWTITVDGTVFIGGEAEGSIDANVEETVKLPFTLGFGKVDITITANEIQETYSAFALGPFFLNLQEA